MCGTIAQNNSWMFRKSYNGKNLHFLMFFFFKYRCTFFCKCSFYNKRTKTHVSAADGVTSAAQQRRQDSSAELAELAGGIQDVIHVR